MCTAYLCAQHTVCTLERTNRGILVILLIKWNTSTKDVWAIDRTGDVFCSGVGTDNTLIIDASPVHAAIEIRPTTPPCTACLLPSDRNIQNEQSGGRRRWVGIFSLASYKSNISQRAAHVIGPSPLLAAHSLPRSSSAFWARGEVALPKRTFASLALPSSCCVT